MDADAQHAHRFPGITVKLTGLVGDLVGDLVLEEWCFSTTGL